MYMKMHFAFVALLAGGVEAAPTTTVSAATYAGANTADVYSPASSKSTHAGDSLLSVASNGNAKLTMLFGCIAEVNSSLFPPESVVGFPGRE